ncbi:hypothetical protein BYT27DRAFT_7196078 [Phlegmacium glaucopus]|nr:hypothetical protein BYT27DRAFT_7196078 [Phlegmacium glaucopus]
MALSFIGKPISLISHSDVRYRGILAGIDPQASTIQLSNVYSMGTETRRPPAQFIAPVQEPYGYIIFRASEVKDLSVDEPPPVQHNVHDDPAVLGASAPSSYLPPVPNAPPQNQPPPTYLTQQQAPTTTAPAIQQLQPQPSQSQATTTPPPRAGNQVAPTRRANPVHSAAASLETVERALGDLRVNGGGGTNTTQTNRGGRRGHGGGPRRGNEVEQINVPATDFDFESSNAKFEKTARSPVPTKDTDTAATGNASGNSSEGPPDGEKDQFGPAYNKSTSFFDSLSSSADAPPVSGAGGGHIGGGRGRRGGGGGSTGRNRREEERERNVATFGEPGGVGLLGPGGYVGGWGGYGRRGGRPRRGGGRGGGHAAVPTQPTQV